MILRYTSDNFISLYDYLKNHYCYDFYITENNIRRYIKTPKDLKYFLKHTESIFICEENKEILGVILIWKSIGNNIIRSYVKLNALDENIARKLLTVLLWNKNNDLFVKIKKQSRYMNLFIEKKFNFRGIRGNDGGEILLKKLKNLYSSTELQKKDEECQ